MRSITQKQRLSFTLLLSAWLISLCQARQAPRPRVTLPPPPQCAVYPMVYGQDNRGYQIRLRPIILTKSRFVLQELRPGQARGPKFNENIRPRMDSTLRAVRARYQPDEIVFLIGNAFVEKDWKMAHRLHAIGIWYGASLRGARVRGLYLHMPFERPASGSFDEFMHQRVILLLVYKVDQPVNLKEAIWSALKNAHNASFPFPVDVMEYNRYEAPIEMGRL